ncbi:MAG: hypothetical protein WC222_05445 [Parachlamydiales bacterium]
MALLGFLWALAISLGLRFADVMFLLHVGAENLPVVYSISACIMIVLAFYLLHAYHNFDTHIVYLGIIFVAFLAYTSILCGLILQIEDRSFWYVLRVIGTLSMAIFTTGYWTFVDQYYTLQDAKRLFALFSSSIFLGIATTGVIMQLGLLELEQVYGLITLLLALVGCIVWVAKTKFIPVHDENSLQESASQGDLSLGTTLKMIFSSRFTLFLMASNFLIYVTMVVTEFNYLESFQRHFPEEALEIGEGEQTPLAIFMGRCLIGISLSNLLIGLFIYSRIVHRFGIGGVLPLTGILLFLNYLGWVTSDNIAFAVVGMFVVEGTIYVIDDSNFNLLLNGVSSRLKYRIRIFIESFFEPLGMLISSVLLSSFALDARILGLLLAISVLALAFLLAYNYGRAIYLNLAENAILFHRNVTQWLRPKSEKSAELYRQRLLFRLKAGNTHEKLLAAEGLLALQEQTLLETILKEFSIAEAKQKRELIKALIRTPYVYDTAVIETLNSWYDQDTDEELLQDILYYLACGGFLHPEKAFAYIDSDSLELQGAAIAALKKSWAHLPPVQATQNQLIAVQKQQELLSSSIESEVVMGLNMLAVDGAPYDVEVLIPFLKDHRVSVVEKAMEIFAQLADVQGYRYARLISSLLTKSSSTLIRQSCLEALGKVAGTAAVEIIITSSEHLRPQERRVAENVIVKMGLRTVPILLALTKNKAVRERCRTLAVRILSHLAVAQLHANLNDIVRKEIKRAAFYFYHLHTIDEQNYGIDLSLLKEALETRYRSVIDFVIHALGEAGEIDDCELLARSLASRNSKVRSQVVETLEKYCNIETFRLIYPLVADIPLEEKLAACKKMIENPLSLPELLEKMSESFSPLEVMVAAIYMRQLHLPLWRETLLNQMKTHEEIFHHFAYELLQA